MTHKNNLPADISVAEKKPVEFAGSEHGLERFFKLEHWLVQKGDRKDDRIIWKRGEFVLVVAVTADRHVVLIQEYKQAVERDLWGLVAGGKNKDETPPEAALRELREETGYVGSRNNCSVLGPFFNSPDKSTEIHYVVVVTGVEKGEGLAREESETILEVQLCPLNQTKEKLFIGLHRMAMDVAGEFLRGSESFKKL